MEPAMRIRGRDPAVFRSVRQELLRDGEHFAATVLPDGEHHDGIAHLAAAKQPDRSTNERRRPHLQTGRGRLPPILPDTPCVGQSSPTTERRDAVGRHGRRSRVGRTGVGKTSEDTIVIFLADHGMPFEGAKFNCYPDSLRTPLIIRWPETVNNGGVDETHMVSTVDLIHHSSGHRVVSNRSIRPGRSFLPILRGENCRRMDCRIRAVLHIHGVDALQRSVLTTVRLCFSPWSNGEAPGALD